jgi:hypothetical protein
VDLGLVQCFLYFTVHGFDFVAKRSKTAPLRRDFANAVAATIAIVPLVLHVESFWLSAMFIDASFAEIVIFCVWTAGELVFEFWEQWWSWSKVWMNDAHQSGRCHLPIRSAAVCRAISTSSTDALRLHASQLFVKQITFWFVIIVLQLYRLPLAFFGTFDDVDIIKELWLQVWQETVAGMEVRVLLCDH